MSTTETHTLISRDPGSTESQNLTEQDDCAGWAENASLLEEIKTLKEAQRERDMMIETLKATAAGELQNRQVCSYGIVFWAFST